MKKKRIVKTSLSLLLALTMVLGTATTVFAEDAKDPIDTANEAVETAYVEENQEEATPEQGSVVEAKDDVDAANSSGITLVITEESVDKNLDTVETDLVGAEENLKNTSDNLDTLKEEVGKVDSELAKVSEADNNIDDKMTELDAAVTEANNDATDAADGQKIAENSTTSAEAKEGVDKAFDALTDVEEQEIIATDKIDKINTEIANIKDAIANAQAEMTEAQDALDNAQDNAEKANEKLKNAKDLVEKLQKELEKKEEELKSTGYPFIQTLKEELANADKSNQEDINGKVKELFEAYVKYDLLVEDIPEGGNVEFKYNDNDIDPTQNYVEVTITDKDGNVTGTKLYNYKTEGEGNTDNVSIEIVKKNEVENKVVEREAGYYKEITDPDTNETTYEKVEDDKVVISTSDSAITLGDEITGVDGIITEENALAPYKNINENVTISNENTTYEIVEKSVFTGKYEKQVESTTERYNVSAQDIINARNSQNDFCKVRVEYFDAFHIFNGNLGWVLLPDDKNISIETEWAGYIAMGARIITEKFVDDLTKPIFETKKSTVYKGLHRVGI